MTLVPEAIGIADRPHIREPGDARTVLYKEWWHFNVLDDASGLDLIVNLSLSGDIRQPETGEADLVLLAHEPGRGWMGGITRHDGLAAIVAEDGVDIRLGEARIRYEGSHYNVEVADGANGPVAASLRLWPRAEPMLVWKDTPLGGGHINWVIVPYLEADGEVVIADRRYRLDGARAYHDHNWGLWRWGDNFGWDWGFCAAMTEMHGLPLSLVYDRTVDRAGNRVVEHSLALWHGEALFKFFARRMITVRRSDVYRGPVRRIPGVANLVDHAVVGTIPARIDVGARDEDDWIEASYIPDTALQIGIPRETGNGLVQLNETLGWLTVSGEVQGMKFGATRRACFEFVA